MGDCVQNSEIRTLERIEGEPDLRREKFAMKMQGDFITSIQNFTIKDKLPIENEASAVICALNSKDRELVNEYLQGKGPLKHKDCNLYFALFDEVKQGVFWLMSDNVSLGVKIEGV